MSGPSPAVLLLKAALDQPTLDHVIIPVLNQSGTYVTNKKLVGISR